MQCPQCRLENAESARFCSQCGSRLVIFCPQCGTRLPMEAHFCRECGLPAAPIHDLLSPAALPAPPATSLPSGMPLERPVPVAASPAPPAAPTLDRVPRDAVEAGSSDGPQLIPHLILEQYAHGHFHGRFFAVSLFADISGFSTVTNTLMRHGSEAAEAMAEVMLNIFEPLVRHVYAQGGLITNFAGDAFTALFPHERFVGESESYRQALAAATRIQQHIAHYPIQTTPYGRFPFAIKLGLADGEVDWGILQPDSAAEPQDQTAAYFFSGPAIDRAAAAEHHAQAGDMILSASVHEVLADMVTAETVQDGTADYVRGTSVCGSLPRPQPFDRHSPYAAYVASFLPAAICRPDCRGEFRQVLSLFVKLMDINSAEQLTFFMQSVFRLQRQYGGYLNRVDFGDKGCNLLLFWGMPTSFENDIERALNFILEIPRITPGTFKAGLSYRTMYAGLAGSPVRAEFTAYGGGVSYAARLMMAASWGEVWLGEQVAQRARHLFDIELAGRFAFKGFDQEQPVYVLLGRRREEPAKLFPTPMVGRQAELEQLTAWIRPLWKNHFAGTAVVTGEAGMGKSRLVYEFLTSPLRGEGGAGPQWALLQTDQILHHSLNPFRYWLYRYFDQVESQSESRNKRAFRRQLDQILTATSDPTLQGELSRTRSCLGALVGLFWEDSLYAQLDPKGRFENTLLALEKLIKAESLCQPIVLCLEDAHWLDEDSIQFLGHLVDSVGPYPLALLVTARPTGPGWTEDLQNLRFLQERSHQRIDLTTLLPEVLGRLVEEHLGTPASPELVELLALRSEGNPFFAEQILFYLQEQGLLEGGALLAAPASAIPTDVRAVLIARLDRLTQDLRGVVQAAAVLGREFELHVLTHMLGQDPTLTDKVSAAEQEGIWTAPDEAHYIFRNALLRDTAYEMQLKARRRQLHQLAAEAIETLYAHELSRHYGQVAYHYEEAFSQGQKELWENALIYLQKAGGQAAGRYENTAAIDYFGRALVLAPEQDQSCRYELLLGREQVYHLLGERPAQEQDLAAMKALAKDLGYGQQAAVALRCADYYKAISDFAAALAACQEAVQWAEQASDLAQKTEGLIKWGIALWRQGKLEEAHQQLEKALVLSQEQGYRQHEATSLHNLGTVFYFLGDLQSACDHLERALEIRRVLGDRRHQAQSLNNLVGVYHGLGDLGGAKTCSEQALQIYQVIGDRFGEALVLGNLAQIQYALGDLPSALGHYESALAMQQAIGSRSGEALVLKNLGLALHDLEDYPAAREHCEQALEIDRDVGNRKGEGYSLSYLALALERLAEYEAAAAAYQQALDLRREMGQAALAIDNLAGLARVALGQKQLAEAQGYVEEILSWIAEHGLQGIEYPLRVYITAADVLSADGAGEQAAQILSTAKDWLQEKADRIHDPAARESFLQNVPLHNQLGERLARLAQILA